jgi:hypothetical protein
VRDFWGDRFGLGSSDFYSGAPALSMSEEFSSQRRKGAKEIFETDALRLCEQNPVENP